MLEVDHFPMECHSKIDVTNSARKHSKSLEREVTRKMQRQY